ncbi:TerD family protein [Caryophanon tenue]|uniref:Stress protein n=1 Tax=Caryophanon tenue TaxID=33978 RepID=A0A1C0Y8A0_9BACL|nr:TerD family protein [Caryophanon tenue]OCS83381.1 stress protein [Caryophanon tenue]
MVVNLQKGQRVDLTKGNAGLSRLQVGLGWDPVEQKKSGGLFGGLFGGGGGANIDCDASVIMLEDDRLVNQEDVVYFGRKTSVDGSIKHSGDNLTGEGAGDDETIFIELGQVPAKYNKLVFVVNIYDAKKRNQDFGMIRNAYIRVLNPSTNEELIRYNLSDDYAGQTALITGEIYRSGSDWKFAAVGTGTTDDGLSGLVNRYR